MAIEPASYGYPKASITANKLPIWQQPLSRFNVAGPNDWKVSILTSVDRGIRIEAGVGSGDGVTDETFDYETLSLPLPPSASAWYLIVRRRNWSGTGTSTLVAIRGTAEKKLPTRIDKPGEESDQPLALVRVTQKDRPVQEIVDLRCWASNGGVEVVDRLALDYLGAPGAAVKVGSTVWRYAAQGNGVWGWAEQAQARLGLLPSGGWNIQGSVISEPGTGGVTHVQASVRLARTASDFRVTSTAGTTRLTGAVIPAGFRPSQPVDVMAALTSSALTWGGLMRVRVETDGSISAMPVTPSEQNIGTGAYLQFSADWLG